MGVFSHFVEIREAIEVHNRVALGIVVVVPGGLGARIPASLPVVVCPQVSSPTRSPSDCEPLRCSRRDPMGDGAVREEVERTEPDIAVPELLKVQG